MKSSTTLPKAKFSTTSLLLVIVSIISLALEKNETGFGVRKGRPRLQSDLLSQQWWGIVQPASAQWSYSGPGVGCTDVLDAHTGSMQSSTVSGTTKSITINAASFALHGPECYIRGAFTITLDVAAMRSAAVGAGTYLNVSIVIAGGVHFEGLRDSAAATSTWPLRLPTLVLLFAASPSDPFDPDAMPVDVAVGANGRGVTWTLRDVDFSTTASVAQRWFLVTLQNGKHISRGSRITITNVTAGIERCAFTYTSSFTVNFNMAPVFIQNGLALLDRTQLIIRDSKFTLQDIRSPKFNYILSMFYNNINTPLALHNNSQMIVNSCGVSAINSTSNTMVITLLHSFNYSPLTLHNDTQLAVTDSTVSAVNSRSTSSTNLLVVDVSSSSALTLYNTSLVNVSNNSATAVNSASSTSTLLIVILYVMNSSPIILYSDSLITTSRSNVTAISSNSGSSGSVILANFYRVSSSPLTLHGSSRVVVANTTVTAVDSSSTSTDMVMSLLFSIGSPLTLQSSSQLFVASSNVTAKGCQAYTNFFLGGIQVGDTSGATALITGDARVVLDRLAVSTDNVSKSSTFDYLQVTIWGAARGTSTALLDLYDRGAVLITSCTATVTRTASGLNTSPALPLAGIVAIPTTNFRDNSTVLVCSSVAAVVDGTIGGTYYPGPYTATPDAARIVYTTATLLGACNASTKPAAGRCGLRDCNLRRRTATSSPTISASPTIASTATSTAPGTGSHSAVASGSRTRHSASVSAALTGASRTPSESLPALTATSTASKRTTTGTPTAKVSISSSARISPSVEPPPVPSVSRSLVTLTITTTPSHGSKTRTTSATANTTTSPTTTVSTSPASPTASASTTPTAGGSRSSFSHTRSSTIQTVSPAQGTSTPTVTATATATVPRPLPPPRPIPLPVDGTAQTIVAAVGSVGVVSTVAVIVSSSGAIARIAQCLDDDDDALSPLVHPLRFAAGAADDPLRFLRAAVIGNALLIPAWAAVSFGFLLPFGLLLAVEQRRRRAFAALRAQLRHRPDITRITDLDEHEGPPLSVCMLVKVVVRPGSALSPTATAGGGSAPHWAHGSLRELRAEMGWPSVLVLPLVAMAEGTAAAATGLFIAADDGAAAVIPALLGVAVLALAVAWWVRALKVVVPSADVLLEPASPIGLAIDRLRRRLWPRRWRRAAGGNTATAAPPTAEQQSWRWALLTPAFEFRVRSDNRTPLLQVTLLSIDSGDGTAATAPPPIPTPPKGPPPVAGQGDFFRRRTEREARHDHIIGGKALRGAELGGFLCALGVGVAEGLPATSAAWCEARVTVAFALFVLQGLLGMTTTMPFENVAIGALSWASFVGAAAALMNVYGGASTDRGLLQRTATIVGVLGVVAIIAGLVRPVTIARRMLHVADARIAQEVAAAAAAIAVAATTTASPAATRPAHVHPTLPLTSAVSHDDELASVGLKQSPQTPQALPDVMAPVQPPDAPAAAAIVTKSAHKVDDAVTLPTDVVPAPSTHAAPVRDPPSTSPIGPVTHDTDVAAPPASATASQPLRRKRQTQPPPPPPSEWSNAAMAKILEDLDQRDRARRRAAALEAFL